jgi:trehalose 6-phosphate synthase
MGRKHRVIILSNRLPVQRAGRVWQSSAGGLVTAMKPVLQRSHGSWIGWAGKAGVVPRPFEHDRVRIHAVSVTKKEVERYYNGMSNRTLWPLYHDAIRTPEFRREWWRPYQAVNERFAKAAAHVARKGDTVWVHDFHLQLVPAMLRTLRPDLRIGFFLHIPFPPEELFEWLPWRAEILQGLLGADLIGFQTAGAVHNFARSARQYASATGRQEKLHRSGRKIRVGAFPISIDTRWWSAQADRPETKRRAEEIRMRVGSNRRILLAVDRLDYTKGIVTRLKAYEDLLASRKISVNDCVLLQVAVPSRETVGDYTEIRADVEQMVGRINGEFGVPGRVAVHYFRRNLAREDLAAYYRAAHVMLVTPLRDGMNLVAKEYVACQTGGEGVLVLSQFAGAAAELTQALAVNPRDTDQMSAMIHSALTMNPEDARRRMSGLRKQVQDNDVHAWANRFLKSLDA